MRYKKILAILLSAVTIANSTMPAFATESQVAIESREEEVQAEEHETSAVASEYIASGYIKNNKGGISWSIDSLGNFLLSGKGDYGVVVDKPWEQYRQSIKTAKVNLTDITDCSYMFADCSSLVEVDLSNLDTSQVTSMEQMFSGCESLENIDLSGLDTSQVTCMYGIFSGCSALKEINLSELNTSQVTDLENMFADCSSLEKINLSGLNTSNVVYMGGMFSWCSSLKEIDLRGFDTSQVTSMEQMFSWCSSLKKIDLSGFDTSKVTNMFGMFQYCDSLTNIDLSGFDTSKVRTITNLFSGCSKLEELDLSMFDLASMNNGDYALRGCEALQKIKVPLNISSDIFVELTGDWYSSDGTKWTNLPQQLDKSILLQNRSITTDVIASGFVENSKGGVSWSIDKDGYLLVQGAGDFKQPGSIMPPWKVYSTKIKDARVILTGVTDCSWMFADCSNLRSVRLEEMDTSQVTKMGSMFSMCSSLPYLDLRKLDTGNVTDMSAMFYHCDILHTIHLGKFDTSKVKNMSSMFYHCAKLESIDLSKFNTSNVLCMDEMFAWCVRLTELDVRSFDTSQTTTMRRMFQCCSQIDELDMTNWDLGALSSDESEATEEMFVNCDELVRLKAPLNLGTPIRLEGNWYSWDGHEWNELPYFLEKSVFLQKGSIPKEDSDINYYKPEDIEVDGLEIVGIGTAYARVLYKNEFGTVCKNARVLYKYDSPSVNEADYIETSSDENGYVTIPTKSYWNTSGKNEKFSDTVYFRIPGRTGESGNLKYKLTLNGVKKPIEYSQSWELGVSGNIGASVGAEAGAGVGLVEAEIGLLGIGASVSGSGTISVEHNYEDGQRMLTVCQEQGVDGGIDVEIGPEGGIGAFGDKLEITPIEVSGNVETGISNGRGLQIENYDPYDEEHLKKIGKFLLSYIAGTKANIFLLNALGTEYSNQLTVTESLALGAELGLAKLDYCGNSVGDTTKLEKKAVRSYSINDDLDKNSKEREFELTREFEVGKSGGLSDKFSADLFSKTASGSMNLGTTSKDGKLESITIGKTIGADSNHLFLKKETEIDKIELTYQGNNAKKIKSNISDISKFEQGEIRYFFDSALKKLYKAIDSSSVVGDYVESKESATVRKVGINVSFDLGLGMEVGAELEGIASYEYETEKGSYVEGKKYPSYTANDDLGNLVDNEKLTFEEVVQRPLYRMKDVILECLNEMYADIEDGVFLGDAEIKAKERAKKWIAHLIEVKQDEKSNNIVRSFAISTMEVDEEKPSSVALTVGDPYIVYVTDANGEEVTDYSECPLELTLSYTPEMLQAAKTNASNAKNLGIYMHVDEKAGYVYVGGTVDEANQQVTVEITKPGQYILAIDTLAPEIIDFNVSDSSSTPTINVSFDEKSAFSEFSMKLDGQEIVNTENWEEYYNGSLRRIAYPVETELTDGEHEVSVYAVDSAGNAMKEAAVFTFTVDTELPELSKLTVSVDEEVLRVRAWSEHVDVIDAVAKIQWTNADEEVVTEEYMMDIMDGYYTVMCKPENNALFATVSVVTVDANGNIAESEEVIKNLENPEINSANDLWIRFVDGTGATRSEYEYTGTAIKPKVQIYEGTDLLKEKTDYTISIKNNVKVGTATIIVKSKGNYQGQDTANFTILPKNIAAEDVIANNISIVSNGKQQLKVPVIKHGKLNLSNKKDKDFSVSWPDTAEGAYKDAGTYVIRVTGNGNYTGERDIQLLIGGKTVNKLSVSKIAAQTYTGNAIEIPNLIVKDGKKELINGTDYMVSYKDNVEIGTAKLIITGIGGYYVGTKEISFKIQGISMSKVKVDTASLPKSVIYDGEEKTPELRLYYQANKKADIEDLEKDKDYKVTYQKNVNAGSAQILIEGIGKYSGTMKKSFKINPFDAKVNEKGAIAIELNDEFVYAKGGVKPEPIVKFGDNRLVLGQDYTLTYANNKALTTEKTKKLPVVTVKFKGNFKGNLVENFEITAQSLDELIISVKDKVYSTKKNAWKSSPVITDLDGKILKLGTDYEKLISYYTDAECTTEVGSEIPEAGTYIWVKAEGKGNYAGSCIVGKYRIAASSITKAKVKIEKQYYTGKAIEPDYKDITSVIVNKQELVAGVDYEIVENSYQKNIKVGTATMQIEGKGNYGDVLTVKYTIQKKNFIWRWFEGLF